MGVSGGHSKHATLNQCWFNAGPPYTTLSQHLADIGALSNVCEGGHFDDVTLLTVHTLTLTTSLIDIYR